MPCSEGRLALLIEAVTEGFRDVETPPDDDADVFQGASTANDPSIEGNLEARQRL